MQLPAKFLFLLFVLFITVSCNKKEFEEYYDGLYDLENPIYQELEKEGNFSSFLKTMDKAANRDNHHRLVDALLNFGTRSACTVEGETDKTDIEQTHGCASLLRTQLYKKHETKDKQENLCKAIGDVVILTLPGPDRIVGNGV